MRTKSTEFMEWKTSADSQAFFYDQDIIRMAAFQSTVRSRVQALSLGEYERCRVFTLRENWDIFPDAVLILTVRWDVPWRASIVVYNEACSIPCN